MYAEQESQKNTQKRPPVVQQRKNKTGLPYQLKAGMESLSGMNLDHVRVHYNSPKTAAVQALAYVQETNIHLGVGQEKHLPHEAWHVVQQKQGRVKPTMQTKDNVSINNDAGLEKEADLVGHEAMHLTVSNKEISFGSNQNQPILSKLTKTVIQRKIGFEFETGNNFLWDRNKSETKNQWYEPGRTKGDPMYVGPGFSIEGDTDSNPEIILNENDKYHQIENAIQYAVHVLTTVNKKPETNGFRIMDPTEDGSGWKKKTAFPVTGFNSNWDADIQATQGVRLEHLPLYINDHIDRQEGRELVRAVVNSGIGGGTFPAVNGFLHLIIKFVLDFKKWDGSENEEGPKNAQAFMSRNAYSKMYNSMLAAEKRQFANLFFVGGNGAWITENPVTNATELKGSGRLIPNKYLDSEKVNLHNTTTLENWIKEIIIKGDVNDSMSPPQGWEDGNYGMGLLDMDKNSIPRTALSLLEYRKTDNREDFSEESGKNVPMYQWALYAEQEFKKGSLYDNSLDDSYLRARDSLDRPPAMPDPKLESDVYKAKNYNFWGRSDLRE